jgi:RNA polymerase subunit RPABC4/transcription elongation factor Spt4
MYKNYEEWKGIVKNIDPENYFQSELSKRLGLKQW